MGKKKNKTMRVLETKTNKTSNLSPEEKLLIKQNRIKEKIEAFQRDVEVIRERHDMDFFAYLEVTQAGVLPRIAVMRRPLKPGMPPREIQTD